MALLKLDLHLFHKDARKLSLIAVDVEKDVTVQHVLQQITSIYEISCDDENCGIALFSDGFFIHPSFPTSALLALPGTLLVRPVRVLPEPSLDGKQGKKRRIELLDEDPGICCPSTSQSNSSLAVLPEGHGYLASLPNACGICCPGGKNYHMQDSSPGTRSVKGVLDGGALLQPPKKKRKKGRLDFQETNNEIDIQLHSTPKFLSKDNESVSDELNVPKKKSKKERKKSTLSCNKKVEELMECDILDGSNGKMSEDEECDEPSKRKSVKMKNRVNRASNDISVRPSTSELDVVDENYIKIEKSFVENIKSRVQKRVNYLDSKSNPKSAASASNGRTIQGPHQSFGNVCLQQTKGYSSSHVHNSDVVNSRTETQPDCGSESVHSYTISDGGESSNETNGAVIASTNKHKRRRKHNKRLKREKKRLRALFLGDGTVEMPVEQQHERQKEMQQIEAKYLKRDSAMLATEVKDSEERREYETQLKSVPKLGTKPGKVKIIEGNKFKREKCGIVTFQGKNKTFNSSDELNDNIVGVSPVTVSTDIKVERHSTVKADEDSGQVTIKSTLKGFLDRKLQKTLIQDGSTPSILSIGNSITNNQSQRDLQLDQLRVKVVPKDLSLQVLGAMEASSSSSSVNPLDECSRLPSDMLLKSGNRLPTSMAMIPNCAEMSVKYAKQPVLVDKQFSMLCDMENSSEVSVFKYKRCKTNTSYQAEDSVDELSDSSSGDSTPVSAPRRKKVDDGVRFPFKTPPNPTPFSPESDDIRSDFFFLSSIENPIEPLVYYRYNAYAKDVSSVSESMNYGLVKDERLGNYSVAESNQTTALVSIEVNSSMNTPASVSVDNVRPKENGTSISPQKISVEAIAHYNGVTENGISQTIVADYGRCGKEYESQSLLLNGVQTCSAQETFSAKLPYSSENIEVLEVSPFSANGTKDSYSFARDPPCPNSLETSIVSSLTNFDPVGPIQSPLLSHECEAMAGTASVHTGKLQCLQPMSNRQSKGFKPRVFSALGSLLQQLRYKASTEEKVSANVEESGGLLNGVEVVAITCEKPGTLTEVPDENNAACDVHGLESSQDKSNISYHGIGNYSNGIDHCSDGLSPVSPSTEKINHLISISNENRPNGNKFTRNSKLDHSFCDVVTPKKVRGKRIRKRRGKDPQKLGSAIKSEPFQSFWDVTPEEYKARQNKSAQNSSFVENNILNPSNEYNSVDPSGLPSVLSTIDVVNLPQVRGMPHVGDIVFFYVDDASFTSGNCPTETRSVNGNQDVETRDDSGSPLNGCLATDVVNPLTTCLNIDMGAQQTCLPTSNGERQQLVPVVGKVLTVSEEVVTLQLIGNSSDNASGDHSVPAIDLVDYNGTYNSSGVVKTVLWSSVACPKLVFP